MVLVATHYPSDVDGISLDAYLEKARPEKFWKYNHLKTAKSKSIRI